MGLFTTILRIGSMMDWATPVVNNARKVSGFEVVGFEDGEMAEAERIIKRHGGKGLDVSWDGGWTMMVPEAEADECRRDLAKMRR